MGVRAIAVVVSKAEGCPLVHDGERWLLEGREVSCTPGTRLCAQALTSFFPHLQTLLQVTPSDMSLPPLLLRCKGEGCRSQFRVEQVRRRLPEPPSALPAPESATRRLERGALAAGAKLQEAGTFLSRVPAEVAGKLVHACAQQRHARGEVILADGVKGERLYLVGEGQVEVCRRSPRDGSETVLAVLVPGECFGEMSLLTGEPTSALVRARGEALVYSLPRERLDEFLAGSPELNRVFSQLLAARLRTVNATLESELTRGITGKLSMISMLDLVQTLHASRRTGTLGLHGRGQEAHVVFREGQVAAAAVGSLKGEEAFHALAAWPDGDFCFEQEKQEVQEEARIRRETMGLLMESLRRLDEAKRK